MTSVSKENSPTFSDVAFSCEKPNAEINKNNTK
jgi:hypothetical protein